MKNGQLIGQSPLLERLVVFFMWPKFYAEILNIVGLIAAFFIILAFMLSGVPILHSLNIHDGLILIFGLPSILLGIFLGSRFLAFVIPLFTPISDALKKYDISKRKAKLRYWLHEKYITDNIGNEIPFYCMYQAIGFNGYCMLIVKPNTLTDIWPPQPIKFKIANGLQMVDLIYVLNSRIKKYSLDN